MPISRVDVKTKWESLVEIISGLRSRMELNDVKKTRSQYQALSQLSTRLSTLGSYISRKLIHPVRMYVIDPFTGLETFFRSSRAHMRDPCVAWLWTLWSCYCSFGRIFTSPKFISLANCRKYDMSSANLHMTGRSALRA